HHHTPRVTLIPYTTLFRSSGECERIARRHAKYYRDVFERAEAEAPARPADEWLAEYAPEIDNLRAALDWALSPRGDGSIGVALTDRKSTRLKSSHQIISYA